MTHQEVEDLLIVAIGDIQRESGRDTPKMTSNTTPMRDVPGFDSQNAIEVQAIVAGSLGLAFGDDVFFAEDGRKLFTIGEIASQVEELIQKKGA